MPDEEMSCGYRIKVEQFRHRATIELSPASQGRADGVVNRAS
jgi:hypothetical protein